MFLGFVQLETALLLAALVEDTSGQPVNASGNVTFRVYGPTGLMISGTGTMALADTGAITNATDASPIVVTSANHGLTTGTRVKVASVGGNTAANGDFIVTKVDANTFNLNGSTGNGAYTSGGTWNVDGLYTASYTPSGVNNFAAGQTYSVLVSALVGSNAWGDLHTFTVT